MQRSFAGDRHARVSRDSQPRDRVSPPRDPRLAGDLTSCGPSYPVGAECMGVHMPDSVTQLRAAGPVGSKKNLVVLGDGFASADQATYGTTGGNNLICCCDSAQDCDASGHWDDHAEYADQRGGLPD